MIDLITEARELCGSIVKRDTFLGHGDQKYVFSTLIPELCDALEKAQERGQGCEHCRGWDKRCGANYCPMCGRELEDKE